jgi:hypothetical protein
MTDGDFRPQERDTEIAQNRLRMSKPTDMTIHWKGLEEYFLMVPLVFRFNHIRVKNAFSVFLSKNIIRCSSSNSSS